MRFCLNHIAHPAKKSGIPAAAGDGSSLNPCAGAGSIQAHGLERNVEAEA
jgi:hypothetical protein